MIKRVLILCLSLCLLLYLGCSREEADVVEITIPNQAEGGGTQEGFGQNGHRPDTKKSSQALNAQAGDSSYAISTATNAAAGGHDVVGQVESIVGNRATLTLGRQDSGGAITYGDETAVYLLPVGMPIGAGDFTSVTEGMVLSLRIQQDADGNDTITSISILSR